MPMHDWTRVDPTIYHHFHQQWTVSLCTALNAGILPSGFSALIEQYAGGLVPDVLTVGRRKRSPTSDRNSGQVTTMPQTRWQFESQSDPLLRRANRITIRHKLGEVVSVIEIVSPGNKASKSAIRQFVSKSIEFLHSGINVLLVDPFPPTSRDPNTLHQLIWDEFEEREFQLPENEPLLLASYRAGDELSGLAPMAFLETFCVGREIPNMPAWIDPDVYVSVPLESSYQAAWQACPHDFQFLVENGKLPDDDTTNPDV